ncbi:MAG TPA: hypothetical protein DDY16_04280 [Tenacibaculum sp.]|nr:hypothetical protein [Tenacibaculum sp.]
MYTKKNFGLVSILRFSGIHLIWLTAWTSFVAVLYRFTHWDWLVIPWLPLSLIGTAVAFYVGFKNNSSYDRLWEARKIWGAIVNDSRSWGATTRAFINNLSAKNSISKQELYDIHKKLIYRHISWLYTLRCQLLTPTPWEHINQGWHLRRTTEKRIKEGGVGLFIDEVTSQELNMCLEKKEKDRLLKHTNTATQIIDQQSKDLADIRSRDLLDNFRHVELQKLLHNFYTYQGQCERIKKFPLPRQYGSYSFIFVAIFLFLLPFGIVSEFDKLGTFGIWLSIPFNILIGWVYLMMELIGDYSENPFEGLPNDVPMLSICRTIEIDLKEMLGEEEIPPQIKPKKGILM